MDCEKYNNISVRCHIIDCKRLCRYQSRKRRPFSRYTARADKVRREKSFAAGPGSGVNFDEQLSDIRGNLVSIQAENSLLKRNIEVVKGECCNI